MNDSRENSLHPKRETAQTQSGAESGGPWTGHAGIDRRVLEMTRVIVSKIDGDPTLVRIGLDNIERWTRQKGWLPAAVPCRVETAHRDAPVGGTPGETPRGVRRRTAASQLAALRRPPHARRTRRHLCAGRNRYPAGAPGVRGTHRQAVADLDRDDARAIRDGQPDARRGTKAKQERRLTPLLRNTLEREWSPARIEDG